MNEIPTENLLHIHNMVAAIFRVENSDPDMLSATLDELMAILSGEDLEQFEVLWAVEE